jgi:SAM-dependent MidA family methyltransferase
MTPLAAFLRDLIASEGPISIERFMSLCLQHPTYGYYTTRPSIGRAGDFITAPEISQMFGELIGLWAGQVWLESGAPSPIILVELGPGRGTLMADAWRALRIVPGFGDAVSVYLVETSPRLEALQRETLAGRVPHLSWLRQIADLPDGPALIIANEFFDALPIRQYQRGAAGWHERQVGLDTEGRLCFGLSPSPIPLDLPVGQPGERREIGALATDLMGQLAARIATHGGALLVCDYGYDQPGSGETLQAVRAHAYTSKLAEPGEADLTAHVDFAALASAASAAGARAWGPVRQGIFLQRLGIETRHAALAARADPAQRAALSAGLDRLIGPGSSMATLFKVLAVTPNDSPMPPGFAPDR